MANITALLLPLWLVMSACSHGSSPVPGMDLDDKLAVSPDVDTLFLDDVDLDFTLGPPDPRLNDELRVSRFLPRFDPMQTQEASDD